MNLVLHVTSEMWFIADIVCICEDGTAPPEQPNKLPHIGKTRTGSKCVTKGDIRCPE